MAEADTAEGDSGSAPSGLIPTEEYECKICYNYFDLDRHTPKLLSCSHTFCQECLDILHSREGRGWRIGCPVCRHKTPVPEYQVRKLPDNTVLCEALPLKTQEFVNSDVLVPGAVVSSAVSTDNNGSCQTCKQVAFMTICACAIFSFLSMVMLLFVGLIFVHFDDSSRSPVGPACLFTGSILALFSLILTWVVCMIKYRPETETSNFSSPTSNQI